MKVRPLTFGTLVGEIAGQVSGIDGRVRVLIDGAPAAEPGRLADAVVEPLRAMGRAVQRVSLQDFLRPASVRLEHGRTDSYSYRHDWFDYKGLQREVLDPAVDGRVLPSLWNATTDRASRAEYVDLPENGVVLVDGTLMLDRWLPAELTVHLWLSPGALKRKTTEEWTLPAFDDYDPVADLFVRYDHPERPGLVES
ncbi:uridine kinase [Lentzea sp. NEAU-D7]|uniref:uridine kinase n=1 Tax=Lentzea sp. NEAU-D7 TaxID=2994667 RepID=UPI00224AF874|nr:uridine kinase [Lentzea sp. NEAU-D7]MCX2949637.1 uridine kinase [Lentzea sp. NEAU-D7]